MKKCSGYFIKLQLMVSLQFWSLVKYLFITISLGSTLTQNGSTY